MIRFFVVMGVKNKLWVVCIFHFCNHFDYVIVHVCAFFLLWNNVYCSSLSYMMYNGFRGIYLKSLHIGQNYRVTLFPNPVRNYTC